MMDTYLSKIDGVFNEINLNTKTTEENSNTYIYKQIFQIEDLQTLETLLKQDIKERTYIVSNIFNSLKLIESINIFII